MLIGRGAHARFESGVGADGPCCGESKAPHERLCTLAVRKLPEIDALIERALTVRRLLDTCSVCECKSLDECLILNDAG